MCVLAHQATVCLNRETNSGLRGVWVYEIGTYPFFSNVAPGEITYLAPEDPPQGAPDSYLEAVDTQRPQEQQLEYPPFEPEGQILVHTAQFQPQQVDYHPNNPEVVVVDGGDINVDGGSLI